MSVFFSGFMGESLGMRNKQIAIEPLHGSSDLFVPHPESFAVLSICLFRTPIHSPMDLEKDNHSFKAGPL